MIPQGAVVDSAGNPGPGFDFIGIQFLNQELENFEYETINFAGTIEWAPSDNVRVYFDTIYNDQERRQDSSRIQASGVSSVRFNNVPDTFETINYGSLNGVDLGVPLNHLVGREFLIGDVRCRGIRLCEPCSHLEKITGKEVVKALTHRGGLRAQVLTDGVLQVGDEIRTT